MGSRGRVFGTCIVTALVVVLSFVPAASQFTADQLLELLKSLPANQQAELLREYGIGASPESAGEQRDVSTPQTVLPRGDETGWLEGAPLDTAALAEPEDVLVTPPLEAVTGEALEIRRAFENFLAESQPLEVDRDLDQFGYDLFAGTPTTFAPATDVPVSSDYIIGPGDEIHVQLYGKSNLSVDLQVDRDGTVAFPELGPITVAGLTFREMKDLLYREVENRMIGVSASVSMGRLRSIRIFVLGDVYQPGSYTVSGLSTLTNALFSSGGVKEIGSLRRVQLKRNGSVVTEMDLYDLLMRGDTSDDARLMPGDVVFVPTVGPLAGIAGEVRRPAIYELNGALTVRDLISLGGGLKPTAFEELVQLERIDDGRRVVYDIAFSESDRWQLKGGDLVKVYPIAGGDELAVYLEGNVVRPGSRQFFDGMHVLDLVSSVDDLLPETYFDYGLIESENELNREAEYRAFDLGAALLGGVEEANVPLRPRDRVYIFHRAYFREPPTVSVRGEVRSPGSYEHKRDMRVLDLVLAAGGFTRNAWVGEAELFRTDPRTMQVERLAVDLARVLDDSPEDNIVLNDMDELAVHSVWEFQQKATVEVIGEVNEPGTYPLSTGMKVSDLIFAGGNLREKAYRHEAELTRYEIVDGARRELHHVIVNLAGVLDGEPSADLELQPYDRLLVQQITNWRADEIIRVSGQVAFPGDYPIEEGERLSDLIARFGGFLDDAYLPAAVFRREDIRTLQEEQLESMASQLEADLARLSIPAPRATSATEAARRQAALESGAQLAEELRQSEPTGRMVIRLEEADRLSGTDQDIVLTDGDRLHVPRKPDFVAVMGQVNNPTAFQFERRRTASYFIKLAGGRTEFGDRWGTHVVKADGSVKMGARTRVDPGDVIIVPEDLERFDGMQFLLDMSQVLYQIGLAAASAHTIGIFD